METPLAGYKGSPLSPANPVSTELKSDPIKTSELLRDIANALQSPLPTPADYVRRLEADLAVQATPTPSRWHAAAAAAAAATPSTAAVGQSAKELVASLEALLQQPAATPGRAAMTALRRSTTTELTAGTAATGPTAAGSSSSASPSLAATLSFNRSAGRSELASGTAAAAAAAIVAVADSPAATPTLPRAPTNRWRLAAERAASFRSPPAPSSLPSGAGPSNLGGSSSSSRHGSAAALRQVLFAPGRSPASPQLAHSPADGLLAEIARAVTPAAAPAGAPQLAAAAALGGISAVPAFTSGSSSAAEAAPMATLPASPTFALPSPPPAAPQQADGMGSPLAGRWQAVAAGRSTALVSGSSYPASPVASFGFAAHSPAPLPSLAAASGSADFSRVALPPVQLDLQPPGAPDQTFEAEAGRVLEELGRFAELERSTAADFTAGLAAQLERLFAAPAALAATGTAAGCC